MKKRTIWILLAVLLLVLAGSGYYFRADIQRLVGGATGSAAQGPGGDFDPANLPTTQIRAAGDTAQVSAAGNVGVDNEQTLILEVEGIVTQVEVEVGDLVSEGDLLVAMETTDLERTVRQAELDLEKTQAELDELLEPADEAEIASAEASLASAQEALAEVEAGPSDAEIAAAEASLAASEAKYQELLDGPSEAELTQLSLDLEKAIIALQQAQWDYDKVSYMGEGANSQSATLQEATMDYDAAKASYEISVEPATEAELQEAMSNIETAQEQLDTLHSQPTKAELASAEAQVASAEAQMESLLGGASQAELVTAQINLEQAQIDLEEAQNDLELARLYSPMDGTALSVDVEVGQKIESTSDVNAVTLADLNSLEVTVNVAEVDVNKVYVGQPARITVDALPDQTFNGTVTRIAPSSESQSGVVNYPVTVELTDTDLTGIRPGMTAVADLLAESIDNAWLVPTTSVQDRDGQAIVMIVRDGQPTPVSVTTMGTQGEWTIVQSTELQEGDFALGTVTSFINEEEGGFRGGGMMMMGGGGPPPR